MENVLKTLGRPKSKHPRMSKRRVPVQLTEEAFTNLNQMADYEATSVPGLIARFIEEAGRAKIDKCSNMIADWTKYRR